MLDYRVETFLAVYETLSFTKAATRLSITQPGVSHHIRFLENYYDTKLFSYEGKKMIPTSRGDLLYNKLLSLKQDVVQLKKEVEVMDTGQRVLRLGATLTVGEFMISNSVKSYLKSHEGHGLTMVVANTLELLEKLNSGEIDFAIVEGYFAKNKYDHRVMGQEPYVAVCAPGYLGSLEVPLDLEILFSYPLIIREEGSGTREILQRVIEGGNYSLGDFKNQVVISNMRLIKEVVAGGLGITFMYERAVEEELEQGRLKKIPIKDFSVKHDITCIWRKGSVFREDYVNIFKEFFSAQ